MFSVIVPIHNKLPHLDRSIRSVLQQTFTDFELILVDDCSDDGSSDKIKNYSDPRIRIFRREEPGKGGYAARNLGIEQAKYDWISFLDADDEWSLDYLSQVASVIENHKDVKIVTVGWKKIFEFEPFLDAENSRSFPFTLQDYLVDHTLICTDAISIRKSLITGVGGFPTWNPRCKRGGDVDTWLRCLASSDSNMHIDSILAYYYQDTVNQVTSHELNPSTYFCAYNTVMSIYKQTNDKELKKVIRHYINTKFMTILRRSESLDLAILSKMYMSSWSAKQVGKHVAKLALSKVGLRKQLFT